MDDVFLCYSCKHTSKILDYISLHYRIWNMMHNYMHIATFPQLPVDPDQWILPDTQDILKKVGLKPIDEYIQNSREVLRTTVDENGCIILEECIRMRKPRPLSWWTQ